MERGRKGEGREGQKEMKEGPEGKWRDKKLRERERQEIE